MADWDLRFLGLAEHIGTWSKDRSTRVGCVIVDADREIRAIGYNGFPRGADDDLDARHARPVKYKWTEHAERNAIYNSARAGISINGCTMYLPWFPCMDCARAIVQSGIATLVAYVPTCHTEDFRLAITLFEETGVKVRFCDPTAIDSSSLLPEKLERGKA
jgi:dCMP deaminase